ncbi:MAG: sugar ABC transporter permease [Planctomycetota bacterium]|nr:MAG: sugar ABC transporter permease [Planctomycetota bacterium]
MDSVLKRYLFLIPVAILLGLIVFYPVLRCAGLSFTTHDGLGFGNYARAFGDARLAATLWNTTVFTVFSLVLEIILGLALALCINVSFRGRGIVRAIVLIPWALPPAVMALGWTWIFNDVYGVASDILYRTGLASEKIAWLATPGKAMLSLVIADVWKTTPFVAIILLAGLQSIPKSLYEAAAIDGAGPVRRFFMITLPLLRPHLLLAVLFRGIQAFGVFDLIWVMTRGGPAGSTETISLYIYRIIYGYLNPGYAAALTIIAFLILLAVAVIISILNRRQHELA